VSRFLFGWFICSRIKKRRNPRVKIVTLKLCGVRKSRYILYEKHPTCASVQEIVYYESIKRELKTRPIYECRCDERLKTKAEESMCLTYTGFFVELEHLKIETTLIDEMFVSVMGEYVFLK